MKEKVIGSVLLYLICICSFAQKNTKKYKHIGSPVSPDCKNAIYLGAKKKTIYGPTIPPKGFGKILDIQACDEQDIFTFEKERNSAWYYFTTYEDGYLAFDIKSVNPKNDYDFMLYKWTDSCFCDDVKLEYLLPERVNLSHSGDKQGVPITGLAADAEEDFVPLGVGESFSNVLPVKKGEKYYLVIDNVHPKGQGHIIQLYYLKEITISGTVMDENKKGIAATVWLEDADEKIISAVKCDKDGNYTLIAKIKDNKFYTLLYSSDNTFTVCRQIILSEFAKTNYVEKDIKTTVQKLEKGKKYILSGISFRKGTSRLLPSSNPALNTLARLLLKSSDLKIQIEGNVNNPLVAANVGEDHALGQKMADEVYQYLIKKGIANTRMSTKSYGSLYMIYDHPRTYEENQANNRIEIFLLPE